MDHCPVCGRHIVPKSLVTHIGSDVCLEQATPGKFHDPEKGPEALRLADALRTLLKGTK